MTEIEHGSGRWTWRMVPRRRMPRGLYAEAVALCSEAYEEDYAGLMEEHGGAATHLLGFESGSLVCHALWVPCRVEAGPTSLRAASVEALATRPGRRGQGLARAAMRRAVEAIALGQFELGVLWAFDAGWYERLGWERWRGPVFQAGEGGIEPLPEEDDVMIHRLPRTPMLDLEIPLIVSDERG